MALDCPTWLTQLLAEQLPALEAQENMRAATIAMFPHMKPEQRKELFRAWRRQARRLEPERPSVEELKARIKEHSPEKARAWFEALGIRVSDGGEDHV